MNFISTSERELANEAIHIERQFSADGYNGNNTGPELIIHQGKIPILLSSPHAVNHPRNGNTKLADTFTGTLALQLASITGASALIYAHMSKEDPNYDHDGPYKQQLALLLAKTSARFVLDLHGLSQQRSEEIEIGTALGKTLGHRTQIIKIFMQELTQAGFTNIFVDRVHGFNANRSTTITFFTWQEFGVPALQMEIHKKYRDVENEPENYLKLIHTLSRSIHTISDELSSDG